MSTPKVPKWIRRIELQREENGWYVGAAGTDDKLQWYAGALTFERALEYVAVDLQHIPGPER